MSDSPDTILMEGLPTVLQARLEARDYRRKRAARAHPQPFALELVFAPLQLWKSGSVTVSFRGGTPDLHREISEVASEWSNYGALDFDFGFDPESGRFREWVPGDRSKIRVGFADRGYWSLVGTDGTDPQIAAPGDITLNLQGFDLDRPSDWRSTVLHEFGHAVGFQHEHQSPKARCGFDWERVYEGLAGHPNYWPRWKVDLNLRPLNDDDYEESAHDPDSIMHYALPEWMFENGRSSPCFTGRATTLSPSDKAMMAHAYPSEVADIGRLNNMRVAAAELALHARVLPTPDQDWVGRHLDFLKS